MNFHGKGLKRYKPLILKESVVNGILDEDLYQELCITLLQCVSKFDINFNPTEVKEDHRL